MDVTKNIICLLGLLFTIYLVSVRCDPTIDTSIGQIIGTLEIVNDLDSNRVVKVKQFLGVPFAKPPVGDLRFKKPEPVEPWSEPLESKQLKPACVQYMTSPFPWALDAENKDQISEDCLYLNIWAPRSASPTNKKAVLYWIYGGGCFIGSNRQAIYDGKVLAAPGDIIVATVNYRVGALGFFFSNTEDAPGNVGLWDMLTGLKWVNEHIEAFGGDTSKITIAGESAGSISVGLLSVSPLAHGLYARQIMESGSPAYTLAENNDVTVARSIKVASKVGCVVEGSLNLLEDPAAVISCMRDKDALDIIKAEASLNPGASRSFLPRYGDELLPKNPLQAIADGEFQNSDVLIGNNNNEGAFQITTSHKDIFGFFGEKNPDITRADAAELLDKMFTTNPTADEVIQHYLPDGRSNDYTPRDQLSSASGDFTLLCPTVFFAEKYAEKNKVYFYLYDHTPRHTPWANWMGVVHFDEVQFVFGMPIKTPSKYFPEERDLTRKIIGHWSNFVKNGKPTDSWPLYSKESPKFQYYTLQPTEEGIGPHKDDCDFFRPYFGF